MSTGSSPCQGLGDELVEAFAPRHRLQGGALVLLGREAHDEPATVALACGRRRLAMYNHCGQLLAMAFQIVGTTQQLIDAAIQLGERLRVHPATFEDTLPQLDYALRALRGLPESWAGDSWFLGYNVYLPDKLRKLYISRGWYVCGRSSPTGLKTLEFSSFYSDPELTDENMEHEDVWHFSEGAEGRDPGAAVQRWISEVQMVDTFDALEVEIHE